MGRKMSSNHENTKLDHSIPIPLHYQLSEIIRNELLNGNLVDENGKMITEAEISKRFKVSRITVRSAIKPLVDEGLLWRERGRGTFLKTNKVENWVGQLMGFSETIKAAGFQPGGKVLNKGKVTRLPKKIQENLTIDQGWELKRLRYADDKPIAIEHSFFTPEIGSELEKQGDLDNILTYRFIENELKMNLHEATQIISAVNASKQESEMLDIGEKDALLYIERVTKSLDGKPVEFLQAIYRPDYFHYVILLNRQHQFI
ncbi:GntR family transcriptional regulator [Paenibacillus doosanensis]|uniref:GntR family transcriptional regulator n=1 Tax=Paenibacillus doosanensis TaxID=1229154 RepID=UPI00217F9508|nr:GntR family transcriptional regulator [Paenibacillus doosanensis]MCS7461210.1 GntR family transcriptional regulator [Paenibacillus doosanensis]